MKRQRWQDWVMLALGAWLFVSPWLLGYSSFSAREAWDAYIMGALVFVFAWAALSQPAMWPEWVNLALGIWVIISPYVLGFSHLPKATDNSLAVGILIALDALWAMGQAAATESRQHT